MRIEFGFYDRYPAGDRVRARWARPVRSTGGPRRAARRGHGAHLRAWLLAGLALGALATSGAAQQAGRQEEPRYSLEEPRQERYSDERFATLQARGALILLDVFADWCPVCARQQEILAEFLERHPDSSLRVLTIDFDEQKDAVRRFAAPRQSTLILYRGEERLWFSVAEMRPGVIVEALSGSFAPPQ